MSLTKLLVEKHGGSIEIASVLNQGTTVRVCFPPARTFDSGADGEPPLICVSFGCKADSCQPFLPKPAGSPCKLLSMQ